MRKTSLLSCLLAVILTASAHAASPDFNGDGEVNVSDLLILLGHWGPCPAPCPCDLTGDGAVHAPDLLMLLSLWGNWEDPVMAIPTLTHKAENTATSATTVTLTGVSVSAGEMLLASGMARHTGAIQMNGVARDSQDYLVRNRRAIALSGNQGTSIWHHQSPNTGSADTVFTASAEAAYVFGHATGASGHHPILPFGEKELNNGIGTTQSVTITTKFPNSVIYVAYWKSLGAGTPATPGSGVNVLATSSVGPNQLITAYVSAKTPGQYTASFTTGNSATWGMIAQEIVSADVNRTQHALETIGLNLWSDNPANVLLLSDSIGLTKHLARVGDAIARAWDHPAGWHSFAAGSGVSGSGMIRTSASGSPTFPDSHPIQYATGEDHYGDATFFGGVPVGSNYIFKAGGTGFTPGTSNNFRSARAVPSVLDGVSIVDDWITDNADIFMRHALSYRSTFGAADYVEDFTLKDSGGNVVGTFSPTTMDVLGTRHDPGIVFMENRVNDSETIFASTSDWESGVKWFGMAAHQVINDGNPNGLAVAGLAEASWDTNNFVTNAAPGSGEKSFSNGEIETFLRGMFPRTTAPIYIVILLGPENKTAAQYVTQIEAIRTRINAIASTIGYPSVRYVLVSTWMSENVGSDLDTSRDRVESQDFGMRQVADEHSDVGMISLYGLTDGILLRRNGEGAAPSEQTSWATANGYDSVTTNGGAIDYSTRVINDTTGVHPDDTEAAFLYAWLMRNSLKANGPTTSPATLTWTTAESGGGTGEAWSNPVNALTDDTSVANSDIGPAFALADHTEPLRLSVLESAMTFDITLGTFTFTNAVRALKTNFSGTPDISMTRAVLLDLTDSENPVDVTASFHSGDPLTTSARSDDIVATEADLTGGYSVADVQALLEANTLGVEFQWTNSEAGTAGSVRVEYAGQATLAFEAAGGGVGVGNKLLLLYG